VPYANLTGTSATGNKFRLGVTNEYIKAVAAKIRARNNADTADAPLVGSKISSSGNSIGLNEAAAGSGADWTLDIARPTTGMTGATTITLPPDLAPNTGFALTVTSASAGNIVLGYSSVAAATNLDISDTTSLAFGSTSPVAMFTLPANYIIKMVTVYVDTAFTGGTPTMSVGITGTLSKYVSAAQVDLLQADIFQIYPNLAASASAENLIITYAAGGATAGAARVIVDYTLPS
jgi:hypothetical protein